MIQVNPSVTTAHPFRIDYSAVMLLSDMKAAILLGAYRISMKEEI